MTRLGWWRRRCRFVGETEIFGQFKRAYEIAAKFGTTRKVLNRPFQKAFQAGPRANARVSHSKERCFITPLSIPGSFERAVKRPLVLAIAVRAL